MTTKMVEVTDCETCESTGRVVCTDGNDDGYGGEVRCYESVCDGDTYPCRSCQGTGKNE